MKTMIPAAWTDPRREWVRPCLFAAVSLFLTSALWWTAGTYFHSPHKDAAAQYVD
jgi:hypothetical protein